MRVLSLCFLIGPASYARVWYVFDFFYQRYVHGVAALAKTYKTPTNM